MIKSGQVKPGERLPTEKELTETLGVSRTCVREAMKSLESLRLVRMRPRIGTVVLDPSPISILNAEHFSEEIQKQQADVLLEFRMIVEVGLASLAAERAGAADLAVMENALERYRQELETNSAIDCNTDMAFHAALAAASKNPLGQAVWRMISTHLVEVLEKNAVVPDVYPNTLRDHQKIFRAIKDRNPSAARKAMREHLENADRVTRIALCEIRAQGKASSTKASVPIAIPR